MKHTDNNLLEPIALRVGVYNNFNFTDEEIASIPKLVGSRYIPFVNSNSFVTIRNDYPSIITINPYLTSFIEPTGELDNVKACRIKVGVCPVESNWYNAEVEAIRWCGEHAIPMLFTFQRFVSASSMHKFKADPTSYTFSKSYYRLTQAAKTNLVSRLYSIADCAGVPADLINFCDLEEKGCPTCCNCAKLVTGDPTIQVASMSLSCSGNNGECIFHCPDCWAKRLSKIASFKFDEVPINSKQKGKH